MKYLKILGIRINYPTFDKNIKVGIYSNGKIIELKSEDYYFWYLDLETEEEIIIFRFIIYRDSDTILRKEYLYRKLNISELNDLFIKGVKQGIYEGVKFKSDKIESNLILEFSFNEYNSNYTIATEIDNSTSNIDETTDVELKFFYAKIKTQVGYYFSHDNNIHLSELKGCGFNPDQITEIEIFDIMSDDSIIKRNDSEIDKSFINFGTATPQNIYNSIKHNETVTINDFKYEVPVWYGSHPLFNSEGELLSVPVYIGIKGDCNLDNKVDATDATIILNYYAASATSDKETLMLIPTDNTLNVSSPTDELQNLAAFLADVSENEYGATNWKKAKNERTLDNTDSAYILGFYSSKTANQEKPDNDTWNEVIGLSVRFGEE